SSLPLSTTFSAPAPGNNYFGSTGSSWGFDGTWTNSPNGVFKYRGPPFGPRDIVDGTSNTVAFGEWKTGDFDHNMRSFQDVVNVGGSNLGGGGSDTANANMPGGAAALPGYIALCNKTWATTGNAPGGSQPIQRSWIGELWAPGLYSRTLGNLLLPPN